MRRLDGAADISINQTCGEVFFDITEANIVSPTEPAHLLAFPIVKILRSYAFSACSAKRGAQRITLIGADNGLQREIDDIRGIDDHAHPMPLRLEPEGDVEKPIQPYDFVLPKRMRPENPEYLDVWAALRGYEYQDFETAYLGGCARLALQLFL